MKARVMIADDEELERRALSLILSSLEPYELSLIEATNGRQVVEECLKAFVHIVLLDIQMPGMDGIAAARELRILSPETRIVFVTAFDSFDYAREALRLGVDEYLLKPVDQETVRRTIIRLLEALSKERAKSNAHRRTGEERERALNLLERELRAAVEHNALASERFDDFLALQGVKDNDRFVAVVKAAADDYFDTAITQAHARQVAILAENILRVKGWFGVAAAVGGVTQLIAAAGKDSPDLTVLLAALIESVRRVLGQRVIIGAAPVYLADGPDLFAPAYDAVALATAANPVIFLLPQADERSERIDNLTLIINKALDYIKSHLAEDLSLSVVADQVGCSPFHLSRLFRQHSGATFVNTVTKLRIDAAKALLRTGRYSVKESAALVGFRDQAYFTRVFKRFVDCLPSDFRANPARH